MTPLGKIGLTGGAALLALGGLVACAPLTALNAITPSSGYTKTADIAYGDLPRQQLDVYVPTAPASAAASTAASATEGRTVVVFFYGGSWNDGSRKDYAFIGDALSSRGYVVVVPDYRIYPDVRYPEFVKDSAAAVAWTLQHISQYGGDTRRVFVMGHSAGAYNAAMVALDARWLKASGAAPSQLAGWIGLAGPYDFLPIENPDVKPVFWFPDSPPDSQPIHHVEAGAPPAFLMASHKDKLVEADRNTGGLAQRLRAKGVRVEERYADNTSHVSVLLSLSRPFRFIAPTLDEVSAFIDSAPAVGLQTDKGALATLPRP